MSPFDEALVRREAEHWGRQTRDPLHPQSWEDPFLHELFFGVEERRFLDAVAAAGPRALELGCGFGEHARELTRRGADVTGIDLSEERIRHARERAHDGRPRFVVGNLDTMRLPDGPFDVVYAHDALHHCARLDHVFDEVHRVLRPGGTLVVSDYRGTWRWLRLLAAGLVGLAPTTTPYRRKWTLRRRVRAWIASEEAKRAALERGHGAALHDGSPFEGVSQESIVPEIARRFDVVALRTRLPFWWYVAPKLRLGPLRRPVARAMRVADDMMLAAGVPGAFFTIEAGRPLCAEDCSGTESRR